MMSPAKLARAFARNTAYLRQKAEGVGHAASLHQPPAEANCLNWTVGHIVHYRNQILAALDAGPVGAGGELARYEIESEPITADGPGVLDFARLLGMLDESQAALDAALGDAPEAAMADEQMVGERVTTRGSRVFFLYFHDTLHVGQADVLAELARAEQEAV